MQDKAPSIERDKLLHGSMDYQQLRKEAITMTQQMSGDNWTDYNIHDPGVTILEQFCYALTDIAYRTNLSIETLLFHGGNRDETAVNNALFPAEKVFSPGAITLEDYRVLILDELPNKISNCWVNKVSYHKEGLQGLFEIEVILKNDVSSDEHDEIKSAIRSVFESNRNLCEDLWDIKILQPEKITFSAEIELFQDQVVHDALAEILFELENYFNAPIKFSSLEDLEQKGLGLDEIFDAASHRHGFITRDQLDVQRKEFYVSKIADYILAVKGVRSLRNLSVYKDGMPIYGDIISVTDDKYLTMDVLGLHEEASFEGFGIEIYKGGVLNSYHEESVLYALNIIENKVHRSYEVITNAGKSRQQLPKTKALESYESIQRSFPGIYRLGEYEATNEEGKQRKAQSKQLKAYLLFFDQIMANHLTQLTAIAKLFSIAEHDLTDIRSYFSQNLTSLAEDFEGLVKKKLSPASLLNEELGKLGQRSADELLEKERTRLDHLKLDLAQKEDISEKLAQAEFEQLVKLDKKELAQLRYLTEQQFEVLWQCHELNMEIGVVRGKIALAEDDELKEGFGVTLLALEKDYDEKKAVILQSLKDRFLEQEQEVDFEQRDLEEIMLDFDNSAERKNRLLSHLLARFGERFTTDFHIKFSSLVDGESQEKIDKKLISLKSSFLRNIIDLNRFRARGANFNAIGQDGFQDFPFKSKLSLLLNIEHTSAERLVAAQIDSKMKVSKMTGEDIVLEEDDDLLPKHIRTAEQAKSVRFIVPSQEYYWYLFKFGLKESNYKILSHDGAFAVLFSPPTGEPPTLLLRTDSREKARKKVESIINYFKELNAQNDGFHLVEHILLRPQGHDKFYYLLQREGEDIFKSLDKGEAGVQKDKAMDTLLLACFVGNYKVVANKKNNYLVFVKSRVGKELVKSLKTFPSEKEAETFVQASVLFFQQCKEANEMEKYFSLDDELKYHFVLLNETADAIYKTVNAGKLKQQEVSMEALKKLLPNPQNYKVEGDDYGMFQVKVQDYQRNNILQSTTSFPDESKALQYINVSVDYFIKVLDHMRFNGITRYQRLDARDAEDFNYNLSVVYPNWTARFNNEEFIQLFKQTIFEFVPAHLAINMVGLSFNQMRAFEDSYFAYIEHCSADAEESLAQREILANELLDVLIKKQTTD